MNFSQLQTEVQSNLIDLPAAVLSNIPVYINRAMRQLQALHNFQCQRAEIGANNTLVTQPVVNVNPASMTFHILGTVSGPEGTGTLASDWKESRETGYFVRQLGSVTEIVWEPNAQYEYREVDPQDPNAKGPPRFLQLGDALDVNNTRNVLLFPFSDSQSDWTSAPAGEYRIHIPYWKYLPALVAGSDTNWFTTNAEQFLIEMATAWGFRANWDLQNAALWENTAMVNRRGADGRTVPSAFWKAVQLDASMAVAPTRVLASRRDVYAPRDEWRT